ncbi:hypothetical protein [Arcanobacterium hippocoleae]|uniref:hypothetical protein n=1 Tax=Arcanobacterium hippocoleae TaxID=149017 RepID=UPI003342050D
MGTGRKLVSKGPEPLVRLDLKGIKPEKAQDGTIIYRDVPTYLLEGGNAMMGWQYGYDQPMEKVTFSYNPGGVIEKKQIFPRKIKSSHRLIRTQIKLQKSCRKSCLVELARLDPKLL